MSVIILKFVFWLFKKLTSKDETELDITFISVRFKRKGIEESDFNSNTISK